MLTAFPSCLYSAAPVTTPGPSAWHPGAVSQHMVVFCVYAVKGRVNTLCLKREEEIQLLLAAKTAKLKLAECPFRVLIWKRSGSSQFDATSERQHLLQRRAQRGVCGFTINLEARTSPPELQRTLPASPHFLSQEVLL